MSSIKGTKRVYSEKAWDPIKTVNGAAGWVDWDLSAVCPPYAIVDVVAICGNNGDSMGMRVNGSAADRKSAALNGHRLNYRCKLDGSAVCEVYDPSINNTSYCLLGYWI